MAVTTRDNLVAALDGAQPYSYMRTSKASEAAGIWTSLWVQAGAPGTGANPSVGINGEAVTNATAGVIPYTNAVSGQNYLLAWSGVSSTAGVLQIYDRLWQNSGIVVTTTTAQSITPVAIPSRDINGAALGAGLSAWLEVYTATTNAGVVTTIQISYTNQAGTAGRTGTIPSFPATAVAGTCVQFALQAGDTGIRSIESITLGTSLGGGAVGIVISRDIAIGSVPLANIGFDFNAADLGMPKLYNGTALAFRYLSTTTNTGNINGTTVVGGA